jgi:aryl-phospho-beta-D-glucosidase BglC (GH1 family)
VTARTAIVLFLACVPTCIAVAQDGPDKERLARLARGVNLSHWVWLPHETSADGRRGFVTVDDVQALRQAGFTHARLPFEPDETWDSERHALRPAGLEELRACIGTVLSGGLAVVVDPHPNRSPWVRPNDAGRFDELERFWSALAKELAPTDADRVFLEVLNEPHDLPKGPDGSTVWTTAQRALVAVVRASAPAHTIIATGDQWGGIDGLISLTPLPDANVVYSFHFYEPTVFTHQGATWGWEPWRHMQDVPYPVTSLTARRALEAIADKSAAEAVRRYAEENWDAERVSRRLARALDWSRSHRVPLYCGEFGVYRPHAPRTSRLAWLRDARTTLEGGGIGWAMWDYAGGFALADGPAGARTLDAEVLDALGLVKTPPTAPRPNR